MDTTNHHFDLIKNFLLEETVILNKDELDENTNLIRYGFDSLMMMRLLTYIESKLDIELDYTEINFEDMTTPSGIIKLMSSTV